MENLPCVSPEKWVLIPAQLPCDQARFFWFKKTLVIDSAESENSAHTLNIICDGKYALFVNGGLVGVGPTRSGKETLFQDRHSLPEETASGRVVLTLLLHVPNAQSTTYVPKTPGFSLHLDSEELWSGWRYRPAREYLPEAPLYTVQIGYSLVYDAARAAADQFEEDDSPLWQEAKLSSFQAESLLAPNEIWGVDLRAPLTPGPMPHVVQQFAVPKVSPLPAAAPLMNSEAIYPIASDDTGDVGIEFGAASENQDPGAIIEFPTEVVGYLDIELSAPEGAVLDIGYGERLDSGRLSIYFPQFYSYGMCDRIICAGGRFRVTAPLQMRACRYLQIVMRNLSADATIHSVTLLDGRYPMLVTRCRPELTPFHRALYEMCVNTIHCCALDVFVDCPWREQTLYAGDLYTTAYYWMRLTDDYAYVKRCLQVVSEGMRDDGLLCHAFPIDQAWSHLTIPSFSLLWLLALEDYISLSGDDEFALRMMPVVQRIIGAFANRRHSLGLIQNWPGLWNFIDWTHAGNAEHSSDVADFSKISEQYFCSSTNLLYSIALDKASRIAQRAGIDHSDWRSDSSCITQVCDEVFPTGPRSLIADYHDGNDLQGAFSEHQIALRLLANPEVPVDVREQYLDLLNIPEENGLIATSPFYEHFVLQAMGRYGRKDEALRRIERKYRRMVEANSPTIWESFDGASAFEGAASMCHAFSCAPIGFYLDYV